MVNKNSLSKPSQFLGMLFNNFANKISQPQIEDPIERANKEDLSYLHNMQEAKYQLMTSFDDLLTILESFHQVYTNETTHGSALCEHYQRQAINFATAVKKSMNNNSNFNDLPFDALRRQSETYQLFDKLRQLKNYQAELPSGWYDNVKPLVAHISEAIHYYQQTKGESRH